MQVGVTELRLDTCLSESPFHSVDYSRHISHATGFLAIRLVTKFYNDDVLSLCVLSGVS